MPAKRKGRGFRLYLTFRQISLQSVSPLPEDLPASDSASLADSYTLNEVLAPNQVNFLTWGNVTFPSPGKVRIEVRGDVYKRQGL